MKAAEKNYFNVMEILLEHGASVNKQNQVSLFELLLTLSRALIIVVVVVVVVVWDDCSDAFQ